MDRAYENLMNNYKVQQESNELFEKRNNDLNKQIKNFNFEKTNTNELVIKLLKSKLTSIRNELTSIKAYYNNECGIIKKEYAKTIETLLNKIKTFTLSFERELENNARIIKENLEKEFKIKLEEKESLMLIEIKKVEGKFEKHILEQFRVSERIEKENKNLIETQQNNFLLLLRNFQVGRYFHCNELKLARKVKVRIAEAYPSDRAGEIRFDIKLLAINDTIKMVPIINVACHLSS